MSRPTDEDAAFLEEYLAKKQKKGRREEEVPMEESSTLHVKEDKDYQGRSFLHIPQDLGVNLKSEEPPAKCFIPKRQIHSWKGHNKGVSAIRWFPESAHLMLSGALDNKVGLIDLIYTRHQPKPRRRVGNFFDFPVNGWTYSECLSLKPSSE